MALTGYVTVMMMMMMRIDYTCASFPQLSFAFSDVFCAAQLFT